MARPSYQEPTTISTALLTQDATPSVDEHLEWLLAAQRVSALAGPTRDTLRDTQRVYRFLKLLAQGNYRETASRAAGFAKQTLYDWFAYAKDGDVAAIAVVDALEKAEAEGEAEAVSDVRNAGKHPQFWAAAMTRLERKHPDRWGKRDEASVTAKVQVSIGGVSQAQVLVGVQVQTGEGSLSPSPFASDEGRNPDANLLTRKTYDVSSCPIIGDYVNQHHAVPAIQIPAQGLSGDPGRSGDGTGAQTVSAPVKARRAARKEKKA